MNIVVDHLVMPPRSATAAVIVFCLLVSACLIARAARAWRLLYIFIGVTTLAMAALASLQLTSISVHPFDHSWDVQHEIPIDVSITRMAKRARFDAYVCGIPPIGRGKLRLESAARHGSEYDLFFIPTWASDTLVVYRFAADGKALWKTCNWVET